LAQLPDSVRNGTAGKEDLVPPFACSKFDADVAMPPHLESLHAGLLPASNAHQHNTARRHIGLVMTFKQPG